MCILSQDIILKIVQVVCSTSKSMFPVIIVLDIKGIKSILKEKILFKNNIILTYVFFMSLVSSPSVEFKVIFYIDFFSFSKFSEYHL